MANDDVRQLLILTFEKPASSAGFRSALRAGVGAVMSPLYPASFSTPCVTPIFWGKPSFGSSRRTCQIRLICEWDFGLTSLADPHRLEKILPSQTPHKNGPMGAGMGIRGCFLTPVAKASHRPIQLGQRGDPALSPSDRSNARTLH